MTYKIPMCCGKELVVAQVASVERLFKIKKDGTLYKRPHSESDNPISDGFWCEECTEIYAIEYDEKERLVKGEIIS